MSKNGSGTTLTEVTYTYDNAGQLASDTIDGTTRNYTYDNKIGRA